MTNYTDAVVYVRELRQQLADNPSRKVFALTRHEVELVLAAIDYVTDDEDEP